MLTRRSGVHVVWPLGVAEIADLFRRARANFDRARAKFDRCRAKFGPPHRSMFVHQRLNSGQFWPTPGKHQPDREIHQFGGNRDERWSGDRPQSGGLACYEALCRSCATKPLPPHSARLHHSEVCDACGRRLRAFTGTLRAFERFVPLPALVFRLLQTPHGFAPRPGSGEAPHQGGLSESPQGVETCSGTGGGGGRQSIRFRCGGLYPRCPQKLRDPQLPGASSL